MEALLNQLAALDHWQIALLATGLLLQGAVFTIFPEEVIISALGVMWSQGKIGFFEAMVAVQLGLLPANAVLVFVGDRIGSKALSLPPLRWMLKPAAVESAAAKLRRGGPWLIAITRFTPLIRGPVYFACGVAKIGVLRFMRVDALTSCLQVPLWLIIGGYVGASSSSIMQAYSRLGMGMAVAFGMALLYFAFSRKTAGRETGK